MLSPVRNLHAGPVIEDAEDYDRTQAETLAFFCYTREARDILLLRSLCTWHQRVSEVSVQESWRRSNRIKRRIAQRQQTPYGTAINRIAQRLHSTRQSGLSLLAFETIDHYANLVADVPGIVAIYTYERADMLKVWTVIDTPPFEDEHRMPIYDAQIEVSIANPKCRIDFEVVNPGEYEPDGATWEPPKRAVRFRAT